MKPGDAASRSLELSPKIVDEVRELHERTVRLGREANGPRGRRGRRERRDAREAEADLLRVLGFANYTDFITEVGARGRALEVTAGEPAPRGLSLVETVPDDIVTLDDVTLDDDLVLDARQTEAALLRVLRSERRGARARVAANEHPADDFADLHARIAVFEEELAETRFELRRVRDELRARSEGSAPSEPATAALGGDAPAVLVALAQTAAELRALGESLRVERMELAGMAATARAEAERLLDQARADAQRIRDDAAAEANALLDQARADAVALTRNAISTVDGLRQLAAEERNRNTDES
jgi:cell division septum initiation protein DivIVA